MIIYSAWGFKPHFIPTWMYGKQLLWEEQCESKVEMHEVRYGHPCWLSGKESIF